MRLYHPTLHAAEILRDGFGEISGTYLTESNHSGVWMFDRQVERQMGGSAEATMLELEVPEAIALPYETVGKLPYRQFLMPAGILNFYGPPRVIGKDNRS
jgi:hypothetical protein